MPATYVAFVGHRQLARGAIKEVARACKLQLDSDPHRPLLIFDDETGYSIDLDFRGSVDDVIDRLSDHPLLSQGASRAQEARKPGRPKLGVLSKEVSLLPRHWEWLRSQPRSVSATLRALVEKASRENDSEARSKRVMASIHRFMWSLSGDLPNFEEASRAFFAFDYEGFFETIAQWPEDVRIYLEEQVQSRLIDD